MSLVIRTTGNPMGLTSAVQGAVWSLDKELPLSGVEPMQQRIDDEQAPLRIFTWFTGVFSVVALFLAGIGIYGVMAYLVESRARAIAFIQLNAVPAYGVEPVSIHKQSLRATRAEASRNNFKSIEDAIAICIFQTAHGGSVAHQQAPFPIKGYVVTSSRKIGAGSAIDMKTTGELKLIVEQVRTGQADGERAANQNPQNTKAHQQKFAL